MEGHVNRNTNRELCESTEEKVTIRIVREDFMKHLASADFENIGAGQIETGGTFARQRELQVHSSAVCLGV